MAIMFPEHMPEHIRADPKRSAECKVYDKLATLNKSFTIFYSVAWQGKGKEQIRDGEADFVIAHPSYGIFIAEVKGGRVSYDPKQDQWISTDRDDNTHIISDPFKQAMVSKHALMEILQGVSGWSKLRFVTNGHIVIFPDFDCDSDFGPDKSREIIIDAGDLVDINNSVQKTINYYQRANRNDITLGNDGLDMVKNLLAHSFTLTTKLGTELGSINERLIQLTNDQFNLLNFLKRHRRVAISGCAGSGKTMLALEKANRLADQGFQVLLTCYTKPLAEHIAQFTHPNVTVSHFHGLCETLIRAAGYPFKLPEDSDENKDDIYDVQMPQLLMDAMDKLGPKFDAIIVDEGQDFHENWWIALSSTLKDPEEGIFYVFYDDNQNIFQVSSTFGGLISEPPYPLTINCRNTQAIHKIVSAFHSNPDEIDCKGPVGIKPEIILYSNQTALKSLVQSKLHSLIKDENVASSDVVILSPKSRYRTIFNDGSNLGNFKLTMDKPKEQSQVWATSVYRYKGLESLVVIMVELDESVHRDLDQLIYVGCSRAKAHLIVYVDENFPDVIKSKLASS